MKYRVNSNHPEDLADGRSVTRGEVVSGVDESDEHNARLIEEGVLRPLASPPPAEVKAKAKTKTAKAKPEPENDNEQEGGDES